MHILIAAYLFTGGAYSTWSLRKSTKQFVTFWDYFSYIVATTFLWPLLALKDLVLKLFKNLDARLKNLEEKFEIECY